MFTESLGSIGSVVVRQLFRAFVRGGRRLRSLFVLASISVTLGIISEALARILPGEYSWMRALAVVFGVIGGLLILGIAGYQQAIEETKREEAVQRA